jgi:hypothetical protein
VLEDLNLYIKLILGVLACRLNHRQNAAPVATISCKFASVTSGDSSAVRDIGESNLTTWLSDYQLFGRRQTTGVSKLAQTTASNRPLLNRLPRCETKEGLVASTDRLF